VVVRGGPEARHVFCGSSVSFVRPLEPPDPPLRDGELLLRPSREADAPAIRALYSEPDIRR